MNGCCARARCIHDSMLTFRQSRDKHLLRSIPSLNNVCRGRIIPAVLPGQSLAAQVADYI